MEEEITQIRNEYRNSLNNLISYARSLINKIHAIRMSYRLKHYYRNRVILYYRDRKKHLESERDRKILLIKEKYKYTLLNRNKKACLIGINYTGTSGELRGCVNDVNMMKELLITKYGYNVRDIDIVLNEKATKKNILAYFTKLVQSAKSGDTLCFSFSGHGYFTRDRNGEESDSKDELLISVDYYGVVDDELKSILRNHMKPGVKMFALFDNCHSGTILDLRYQYLKENNKELIVHSAHDETKGQVILLSGCKDSQVSMDAFIAGQYNGALTSVFVNAVKESNEQSWETLLNKVRANLKKDDFYQIPQLSSGQKMNYETDIVSL